jgi:heme oxygenase
VQSRIEADMGLLQGSPGEQILAGSSALRLATAREHESVERALGLPGAIESLADYRRWLSRFFGIYSPLEERLRGFPEWDAWGISIAASGQSAALRRDLVALGCAIPEIELASAGDLPGLHGFAPALGALYVLEGSKLGGRIMLKDLCGRLGDEIAGADAFFRGNGAETMPAWIAFRTALDRFFVERPDESAEVVRGAKETFQAIERWMAAMASPMAREPSMPRAAAL